MLLAAPGAPWGLPGRGTGRDEAPRPAGSREPTFVPLFASLSGVTRAHLRLGRIGVRSGRARVGGGGRKKEPIRLSEGWARDSLARQSVPALLEHVSRGHHSPALGRDLGGSDHVSGVSPSPPEDVQAKLFNSGKDTVDADSRGPPNPQAQSSGCAEGDDSTALSLVVTP